MDKRLAIDVGGSSIKYALVGEEHKILEQGKVRAPREVKEEFVEALGQLYDRYAGEISGMGISMAGKVDPHTGFVVSAGSFPFFTGTNMLEAIAERCPTHLTVDNDARCAALADRVYVYDNSVDDAEARLLFRMTDGKPFKLYTDDIPLWAQSIIG